MHVITVVTVLKEGIVRLKQARQAVPKPPGHSQGNTFDQGLGQHSYQSLASRNDCQSGPCWMLWI